MELIQSIDTRLLLLINGSHNPTLDWLMFQFSEKLFWLPLYALLIFAIFKCYGKRGIILIFSSILVIALCDQIASHLIKNLVQRYRPSHQTGIQELLHYVNNYRGGDYGFISSHASNSFGLATFLYHYLKNKFNWLGELLFIVAILISYSRIYLGVHFPSDVIVGNILGICIGLMFIKILSLDKLKGLLTRNDG